jgi:hypothetical protein
VIIQNIIRFLGYGQLAFYKTGQGWHRRSNGFCLALFTSLALFCFVKGRKDLVIIN